MALYQTPGVYVEEVPGGARPIEAVGTSTPAFVGAINAPDAPVGQPIAVNNWLHFRRVFATEGPSSPLTLAVAGFFGNGGRRCWILNVGPDGNLSGTARRPGISALAEIDEVAMVAAPGYTDAASYEAVLSHCEDQKDRVAILDAPRDVPDITLLTKVASAAPADEPAASGGGDSDESGSEPSPAAARGSRGRAGLAPRASSWGSFYFPYIRVVDPNTGDIVDAPPSGHIAGVWARTDATRGVHKAPANEPIRGAVDLTYRLTAAEQGELNQHGVNAIRFFSTEGIKVWGARTLSSDPEWRYLNVRRLFAMVEESIVRSMNWIVFEPNDEPLWNMIRRDIGSFLERLYRQGALQGRSQEEAFFVKCDAETNPQSEIDAGVVTTLVGMAPVKPAEFIVFKISQHAGGATVEREE